MPKKLRRPKPKTQRGPRGAGSAFKDKRRGGYRGKVPVGRYPDGSTRYSEVRAPTQAECLARMRLVQPPGPTTTVSEWAERWLRESGAQPQSKDNYSHIATKHVVPAIGAKRVADLTTTDVQLMVLGWEVGANTARHQLAVVRGMLNAARRAGLVSVNVARDVRPPKAKKVPIRPFTLAELARIIPEARRAVPDAIFALLATVGCRLGEATALDVADYDRGSGRLSITKTYTQTHGVRRPKSENGLRTVTVPKQARPALLLAIGGRKKGPLFATGTGGRRQHSTVRRAWHRLLKRLGITYRSPHQLRHSVATHSIARGVHVGNVARDLGDAVRTIISTYVHAAEGDGPCEAMESLLGDL